LYTQCAPGVCREQREISARGCLAGYTAKSEITLCVCVCICGEEGGQLRFRIAVSEIGKKNAPFASNDSKPCVYPGAVNFSNGKLRRGFRPRGIRGRESIEFFRNGILLLLFAADDYAYTFYIFIIRAGAYSNIIIININISRVNFVFFPSRSLAAYLFIILRAVIARGDFSEKKI